MRVLIDSPLPPPVSAVHIDLMNLENAEVRREWRNIDILVHDQANQLVVIIENKISSGEHSNQLQRYYEIVQGTFPDAEHVIAIFLTPEGDVPSDEQYLPMSYDTVAEVAEMALKAQSSTLGPDVRTLMAHYLTMLRRHIVSESEIGELARKIYSRHQRALDLIFEHRPDLQLQISEYLMDLIRQTPGLLLDHCSKTSIRFIPQRVAAYPALLRGEGWTSSKRVVLFEFWNGPDRLVLKLVIGPGDQQVRQKLYEMSATDRGLFQRRGGTLYPKWTQIYAVNVLVPKDYDDATSEDLLTKIQRRWSHFMDNELPRLTEYMESTLNTD